MAFEVFWAYYPTGLVISFNESNSIRTNKQSESFKFNSSEFGIVNLNSEDTEDKTYWLLQNPNDHLIVLEGQLQLMSGYDSNSIRLQKVYKITK